MATTYWSQLMTTVSCSSSTLLSMVTTFPLFHPISWCSYRVSYVPSHNEHYKLLWFTKQHCQAQLERTQPQTPVWLHNLSYNHQATLPTGTNSNSGVPGETASWRSNLTYWWLRSRHLNQWKEDNSSVLRASGEVNLYDLSLLKTA